jgi:hypothetical protein
MLVGAPAGGQLLLLLCRRLQHAVLLGGGGGGGGKGSSKKRERERERALEGPGGGGGGGAAAAVLASAVALVLLSVEQSRGMALPQGGFGQVGGRETPSLP